MAGNCAIASTLKRGENYTGDPTRVPSEDEARANELWEQVGFPTLFSSLILVG